MKEVILRLSDEAAQSDQAKVVEIVQAEVADFERYLQGVDWKFQGPLLPQERILLQTYLVQKLRGRI